MALQKLIEDFKAWLEEREITEVEVDENGGPEKNITTVTFPVEEESGVAYDIIASLMENGPAYFYVEYCDIPEIDELELLRFVNDLNKISALTVTVEDGHLCFGYTIAMEFLANAELFSQVFFDVWDAVDEMREDIVATFSLVEVYEENEEAADAAEEAGEAPAGEDETQE